MKNPLTAGCDNNEPDIILWKDLSDALHQHNVHRWNDFCDCIFEPGSPHDFDELSQCPVYRPPIMPSSDKNNEK
jgi:hypothetical protein